MFLKLAVLKFVCSRTRVIVALQVARKIASCNMLPSYRTLSPCSRMAELRALSFYKLNVKIKKNLEIYIFKLPLHERREQKKTRKLSDALGIKSRKNEFITFECTIKRFQVFKSYRN